MPAISRDALIWISSASSPRDYASPLSLTASHSCGQIGSPGAQAVQVWRAIMDSKLSPGQRWEAYRPSKALLFWSCAACIVATMVVGFNWGGWTTGGTAAAMAKTAALDARQELAADVCTERFQAADDANSQFVALKALTSAWDRGAFVEKGGWAVMPGAKAAPQSASQVARLCADRLALVEAPSALPSTTTGATGGGTAAGAPAL
jgi:hypothetical protein